MIRDFTDLKVWQSAHELAVEVYKLTKNMPAEEKFALTSQIRRAASSVTANIAEGFGRNSAKDREHFYVQASGSLYELRNHFLLARDVAYFTEAELLKIMELIAQSHRLLNGLLRAHRLQKSGMTSNL